MFFGYHSTRTFTLFYERLIRVVTLFVTGSLNLEIQEVPVWTTLSNNTGYLINSFVRVLDLHNPSAAVANRLGYPLPIIPHNEARERALRRFKHPGVE